MIEQAVKIDAVEKNGSLSNAAASGVERCRNLPYRIFEQEFLKPNKPVIFEDAIDHWAALGKWTPEFFRENYQHMNIGINNLTMGEFIDEVLASPATQPENLPYFRNAAIREWFPELQKDVDPLPVFMQPNWFNNRLIPARIREGRTDLFIGGVGSKFPYLHWDNYHGYAFLFQIYGEKEYIIFPPDQGPLLYPKKNARNVANVSTIPDIENADYDKFPLFLKATPIRCTLKAGEGMFMPAGWWHTAKMLSPSITVSSNTANAWNWDALKKDHFAVFPKNPLKALLGHAFLSTIQAIESSKDKLYRNRRLYAS